MLRGVSVPLGAASDPAFVLLLELVVVFVPARDIGRQIQRWKPPPALIRSATPSVSSCAMKALVIDETEPTGTPPSRAMVASPKGARLSTTTSATSHNR